ncbi:adenosine deaminase-like protein [Mycena sp. CBHHK59/15]|nr:adenosine deaminase-like protein [Mycena sp. CBHHK59/15]
MSSRIAGPAAAALASLNPIQIAFIHALPKAELHAHLNGSIPIAVLQQLAVDYAPGPDAVTPAAVQAGLAQLQAGVVLDAISDFFDLFPAIYALTVGPASLRRAAHAVLAQFLDGPAPACVYLELRSTPRMTPEMSRLEYVRTVLDEVERYPPARAALIVSLDRRMDAEVMRECVEIATTLKAEGRRVVGVDLCGDPQAGFLSAGNVDTFSEHFANAQRAGLGITLHIAETLNNSPEETLRLLSYAPSRLGHATFLNEEAKSLVLQTKTCIEICLSSNLLCKTVTKLEDHHIRYYLAHNHPIAICTDDTLPFRTSLDAEYALLLASRPLGLACPRTSQRGNNVSGISTPSP